MSTARRSRAADDRAQRIARIGYDYGAREKTFSDVCELCGSGEWTILTHRDRYGFPAQATACGRCGLTILNPRMTPAEYARFYDGVYRPLVSAYHGRRIDADSIQAEQLAYAVDMAEFATPFLEDAGAANARAARRAMLDVGGSTGVVAAYFAGRFGLDAAVLDPSPAEIAVAARFGIATIRALLEDWEPDRRYHLVAMFQTVDHLLDVSGALAKLRAALSDDGLLLLDIVDFRAAYLRSGSVEEAVKIDHPYSFTQETIQALLARAGFRVARRNYPADHLHVGYLCRPAEPQPDAVTDPSWVRAFFDEVRRVQNRPAAASA